MAVAEKGGGSEPGDQHDRSHEASPSCSRGGGTVTHGAPDSAPSRRRCPLGPVPAGFGATGLPRAPEPDGGGELCGRGGSLGGSGRARGGPRSARAVRSDRPVEGPPGASLNASLKPGQGVVGGASPGHAPLQVPLRGTCGPDLPPPRTNESSTLANNPTSPARPLRRVHRAGLLCRGTEVLIAGEELASADHATALHRWATEPVAGIGQPQARPLCVLSRDRREGPRDLCQCAHRTIHRAVSAPRLGSNREPNSP